MTEKDIKLHHSLAPFSILYEIGVRIRNQLFEWGILSSEHYPIPIISIGNLSVGGTGKTPHTEYIINLLKKQYKIAVLSRGYKRHTSGFIIADDKSSSREIGDEPYQMKNKFTDILVAVDSNRRRGIKNLLALPKEIRPEVILLDDAFQHRYVKPSLSLVLTDYHRLFYYDKIMPVGRLREPIQGIKRADIVIVTKCKNGIKPIEFRIIEENMKLQAHQKLFFTRIKYDEIKPIYPEIAHPKSLQTINKNDEILLISGIAAPDSFIEEVKRFSTKVRVIAFPDHHSFNKSDFKKLNIIYEELISSNKFILVTEKDAARLKNNPFLPLAWKQSLYYLPITIDFYQNRNFDEIIKKHIDIYKHTNTQFSRNQAQRLNNQNK